MEDQATVGVGWQLEDRDLEPVEFSVIYGESGVGTAALYLLVVAGIVASAAIVGIALLIKSRYGHSPD